MPTLRQFKAPLQQAEKLPAAAETPSAGSAMAQAPAIAENTADESALQPKPNPSPDIYVKKAEIFAVSITMLSPTNPGHLENFADNFKVCQFDAETRQLQLQFQLVSLFRHGEILGLWLADSNGTNRIAGFQTARPKSLAVNRRYPDIAWSANCRYVVSQTVSLGNSDFPLALMADFGDRTEKIATITIDDPVAIAIA